MLNIYRATWSIMYVQWIAISLCLLGIASSKTSHHKTSILAGVQLVINKDGPEKAISKRLSYGDQLDESIVLGEDETLIGTIQYAPEFKDSSTKWNGMVCHRSRSEKKCQPYSFNTQKIPSFKLNANEIYHGEYELDLYLFPVSSKSATMDPIQWHLGSISIRSNYFWDPIQALTESGPNAWKEGSPYQLPDMVPNDPKKSFPSHSTWTYLFMILVLLPWIPLLYIIRKYVTKVNMKEMRSTRSILFQAILFQTLLVAVFATLLWNWLVLDIFTTIKYLSVLLTALVLVGAIHLHSLALKRSSPIL